MSQLNIRMKWPYKFQAHFTTCHTYIAVNAFVWKRDIWEVQEDFKKLTFGKL